MLHSNLLRIVQLTATVQLKEQSVLMVYIAFQILLRQIDHILDVWNISLAILRTLIKIRRKEGVTIS